MGDGADDAIDRAMTEMAIDEDFEPSDDFVPNYLRSPGEKRKGKVKKRMPAKKKSLPAPKKLRMEWMDGRVEVFDCVSVWSKPEDALTGVRKLDGNWVWFVTANIRGYQYV